VPSSIRREECRQLCVLGCWEMTRATTTAMHKYNEGDDHKELLYLYASIFRFGPVATCEMLQFLANPPFVCLVVALVVVMVVVGDLCL